MHSIFTCYRLNPHITQMYVELSIISKRSLFKELLYFEMKMARDGIFGVANPIIR